MITPTPLILEVQMFRSFLVLVVLALPVVADEPGKLPTIDASSPDVPVVTKHAGAKYDPKTVYTTDQLLWIIEGEKPGIAKASILKVTPSKYVREERLVPKEKDKYGKPVGTYLWQDGYMVLPIKVKGADGQVYPQCVVYFNQRRLMIGDKPSSGTEVNGTSVCKILNLCEL
jgi:hypothetical protein